MRRGRPPYPDVLTPREWEVLELLRNGLTNQQIGDQLGISERGAKFHVSEIMSKLGLESRYEAASWQRSSSRWGFAFFTRQPWPIKVGAALILLLGSTSVAVGIATSPWETDGTPRPSAETPVLSESFLTSFCERPDVQCLQTQTENPTTLEAAADSVSFKPIFPKDLPAGFAQKDIHQFSTRDSSEAAEAIVVSYQNPSGKEFVVSQGYLVPHSSMFSRAPDHLRGVDIISGFRLYWYRGQIKTTCCPPSPSQDWEDNGWTSVFIVAETKGQTAYRIAEQQTTPPEPDFPRTEFIVTPGSTSAPANSSKSLDTDIFVGVSSNSLTKEELGLLALSMVQGQP